MLLTRRAHLLAPFLALACTSTDEPETAPDAEVKAAPLYAVVSAIFSDDGPTTYVSTIDSLDIDALDLDQAREFPGLATVAASGGKLFVSDAEAPEITRFSVSDRGVWREEGTISFANRLSEGGVSSVFVDGNSAYAPEDVVARIVWDPSKMTISEVREAASGVPLERDGYAAYLGHDHMLRDGRVYQPVYWADDEGLSYAAISQIIVYDTDSDEVVTVLDAPCPHLHIASRDEAGNLYFSNGARSGTAPLFDKAAARNCVVRIKAGEDTLDEDYTWHFADVTEGREGAGFRILDGREAFFAVFHDEEIEITNDSDPWDVSLSAHWRLWRMDLETRAAEPIADIAPFSGQYLSYRFADRTFISFPSAKRESTSTQEILESGEVTTRFVSDGWAFDMIKVR
jgi:hypothetical protein